MSTDGTILASGGDAVNASPAKMMSLEKTIGKELQDNIAKTLTPYLGFDNFEISVAARLNTDKRQTNETAFNPEIAGRALGARRSRRPAASRTRNARTAVGVEQNVPAEQATPASGDQSKRSNERREELTNYEVSSKTTRRSARATRSRSLTIAVVVNRKRLLARSATSATPEAVDKQLKEVERLVETAAGIDAKRGDRITVSAVEFLQGGQRSSPSARPASSTAARATGQHRQCLGHRRRDGAADLVRAAAGDEGHPRGQGRRPAGCRSGR